jgi:hypothetical protein
MNRRRFFVCALTVALSAGLAWSGRLATVSASSTPPARGLGSTAPSPVAPIVKEMKDAQTRLKAGDTGPGTRGIQEQVVRDLEKLIDAASRQSDSSSSRKSPSESKAPKDSDNGQQQPSEASQRGQSEGAAAAKGGSAPGTRGGPRAARPVSTKGALASQRSLVREVWGHLPPAIRERVRVDFGETVLPAYDELVRRYFEALLEEPPQRDGKGRAPAPPSK